MIQYELAEDIDVRTRDIVRRLEMTHIDATRVACIRSKGSNSKRVIARCHGLPRIMQMALKQKPQYVIEVVSERFDALTDEDQTKVLIHELMHIPHAFGGGLRSHNPYVTQKKVEKIYRQFLKAKHAP